MLTKSKSVPVVNGPHGSSGPPEQSAATNAAGSCAGTSELLTAPEIRRLLKSQEYRCALTGRELTPQTASIDHRQPLARGGSLASSNVQIVHIEANAAKGNLPLDDFVQLCREVVAWKDSRRDA